MTVLSDSTYLVQLGFMPRSYAIDDHDHPGLLRAGPRAGAPYGGESVEFHDCRAVDGLAANAEPIDLFTAGFDVVDLRGLADLQQACARVRAAGRIADAEAATIRTALNGATLPTSGGRSVTVRHITDEGFIMRSSGPNRLAVVGPRNTGMNDHGAATSVHADQDVFGTPLKQLMDGRAPTLFHHDSPDGSNDSSLFLANFWIPLHQITQPLALADGRDVDRRRHQLRYGLATDAFLDRDDEMAINDIWTFLHDPDQRWYFRSEMDHANAYVFNTLSTPHGAAALPGEEVAEQCYLVLEAAEAAARAGDMEGVAVSTNARPDAPEMTTPALANAITAMLAVIDDAAVDPGAVCGPGRDAWLAAAAAARRAVVRMSLELRMVVSVD